eukprot:1143307-Rhodomonas_salina.1
MLEKVVGLSVSMLRERLPCTEREGCAGWRAACAAQLCCCVWCDASHVALALLTRSSLCSGFLFSLFILFPPPPPPPLPLPPHPHTQLPPPPPHHHPSPPPPAPCPCGCASQMSSLQQSMESRLDCLLQLHHTPVSLPPYTLPLLLPTPSLRYLPTPSLRYLPTPCLRCI